jgi:hypothetical protein
LPRHRSRGERKKTVEKFWLYLFLSVGLVFLVVIVVVDGIVGLRVG